jgi:predicted DNA-binding protein YlxM (UPF0122 family)
MIRYDTHPKRERNAIIYQYFQEHPFSTLQELGEMFHLSKQRIFDILKRQKYLAGKKSRTFMMNPQLRQDIAEAEKQLGHATGIGKIDRRECPLHKSSPGSCTYCSFGHMLDCHYPKTCEQAQCSRYQKE